MDSRVKHETRIQDLDQDKKPGDEIERRPIRLHCINFSHGSGPPAIALEVHVSVKQYSIFRANGIVYHGRIV